MGEIVDVSEKLHGLLEVRSYWDGIKMTNSISKGSFTLRLAGAFNLADVVPWLGAFDLQGLKQRCKEVSREIDQLFEKIIKMHEEAPNTHKERKHQDFMGILVSLMNQPKDDEQNHDIITRDDIKATTLSLISGVYENVDVTVEWTMSELLRNPRVMKNLQDKLETVIGMNKMEEEMDLSKLNYLNLVVMENFRLHPLVPLIPASIRKRHYGCRKCLGMQLGLTTVKLVIAQLVHCYNWELPFGMKPDDLGMNESFGVTVPRFKHLLVVLTQRLSKVYDEWSSCNLKVEM